MRARGIVLGASVALAFTVASCGGGGGSGGEAVVWAPQVMGLGQLWEIELAPALEGEARLEEVDVGYEEIEPTLRAAIEAGDFEADLVMVPEFLGRRLLADGVLAEPHVVLFSDDDPDVAAGMFGVLMAPPAAPGGASEGLSSTPAVAPGVEYEHGCLTEESKARLRSPLPPDQSVGGAQWALEDARLEEIEGMTEAEARRVVENVIETQGAKAANEIFDALARSYGSKAAQRLIARANLAWATFDTAVAILKLGDAAADVIEARSEAVIAATETFYDAVGAISDARTSLYEIRAGLRSCDLSADEARMQIDALDRTVRRSEDAARAALSEIATLRGDAMQLKPEALDNAVGRYLELLPQIRGEADAKDGSTTPDDLTSLGETVGELVDAPESGDPDWETFAMLLTGLDPDNPFTHSDGELMSTATGPVDMIYIGGFWLEVPPEAVDPLFSDTGRFPCGMGPVGRTHCGAMPFPSGRALMIAMVFAEAIPDSAPGEHFQYGFPMDADGIASNNYMPTASYPNDLFGFTDWWLELGHDGASDTWGLGSTLARDGTTEARATGSRIVVNGNSMLALVPGAELETTMPGFRGTAFRHTGDYGLEPPHDFNGDIHPAVGDPLMSPPGEPIFKARVSF